MEEIQELQETAIIHDSLSREFNALHAKTTTTSSSPSDSFSIEQSMKQSVDHILENLLYHLDQSSLSMSAKGEGAGEGEEQATVMKQYRDTVDTLHTEYTAYYRRSNDILAPEILDAQLKKWRLQYKKQSTDCEESEKDMVLSFHSFLESQDSVVKSKTITQTLSYLEILKSLLEDPKCVLSQSIVRQAYPKQRTRGANDYEGNNGVEEEHNNNNNNNEEGDDEEEDDDEEEEDDLKIAGGQISLTCPITGSLFVTPLCSVFCGHVFDQSGLLEYFQVDHEQATSRQFSSISKECPQEACFKKLKFKDFIRDEIMELRVKLFKYGESIKKAHTNNDVVI